MNYEAEACDDCIEFEGDGVHFPTNWRRGRTLGRGGFSTVYEVIPHHENPFSFDYEKPYFFYISRGKKVAVKQFENHPEIQSKYHQAFRREISIFSKIMHPRIVSFFQYDISTNHFSIFLEKIEMGSIEDYLYNETNENLSEEEICQITKQILEGLSYLHSANIIHRDIKGGNVLLVNKFNVKLTDFGSSKLLLNNSTDMTLCVGTTRFMAPELFLSQPYSNRVDIWSLGCTIIQMINRARPFNEISEEHSVMFKLMKEDDPSPAYCVKTKCSDDLKNLIHVTLKKEPSRRPPAETLLKEHPFLAPISLETKDTQLQENPLPLHGHFEDCKKYPGHTDFIAIDDFDCHHLPETYRDDKEIVDFVKTIAVLTLQISVESKRDLQGEALQRKKHITMAGTGYVHRVNVKENVRCCCHMCQISETPSMVWWEVVVMTSTSVICNGDEARTALCRAFFDKSTSPPSTLDGINVLEVNIDKQRCAMTCATCNKEMIDVIKKKLDETESLRGKLMQKYIVGKDDHKLAIIVSHPHATAKKVTVGSVLKKFETSFDETYYSYTTPACPGSSGAAVFILSRIDNKGYHTHSGVVNGINMSGSWVG